MHERGLQSLDALIPQGDDSYLLRNLWCELRLEPASAGGAPRVVTMRPLWFTTDARPLKRVQ